MHAKNTLPCMKAAAGASLTLATARLPLLCFLPPSLLSSASLPLFPCSQLNGYGFSKTDPNSWTFANTMFQRGRADLLTSVQRRASVKRKAATAAIGQPRRRGLPDGGSHVSQASDDGTEDLGGEFEVIDEEADLLEELKEAEERHRTVTATSAVTTASADSGATVSVGGVPRFVDTVVGADTNSGAEAAAAVDGSSEEPARGRLVAPVARAAASGAGAGAGVALPPLPPLPPVPAAAALPGVAASRSDTSPFRRRSPSAVAAKAAAAAEAAAAAAANTEAVVAAERQRRVGSGQRRPLAAGMTSSSLRGAPSSALPNVATAASRDPEEDGPASGAAVPQALAFGAESLSADQADARLALEMAADANEKLREALLSAVGTLKEVLAVSANPTQWASGEASRMVQLSVASFLRTQAALFPLVSQEIDPLLPPSSPVRAPGAAAAGPGAAPTSTAQRIALDAGLGALSREVAAAPSLWVPDTEPLATAAAAAAGVTRPLFQTGSSPTKGLADSTSTLGRTGASQLSAASSTTRSALPPTGAHRRPITGALATPHAMTGGVGGVEGGLGATLAATLAAPAPAPAPADPWGAYAARRAAQNAATAPPPAPGSSFPASISELLAVLPVPQAAAQAGSKAALSPPSPPPAVAASLSATAALSPASSLWSRYYAMADQTMILGSGGTGLEGLESGGSSSGARSPRTPRAAGVVSKAAAPDASGVARTLALPAASASTTSLTRLAGPLAPPAAGLAGSSLTSSLLASVTTTLLSEPAGLSVPALESTRDSDAAPAPSSLPQSADPVVTVTSSLRAIDDLLSLDDVTSLGSASSVPSLLPPWASTLGGAASASPAIAAAPAPGVPLLPYDDESLLLAGLAVGMPVPML